VAFVFEADFNQDIVVVTGEVCPSGLVHPIWGQEEKAIAAFNHTKKTLVLPLEAKEELEQWRVDRVGKKGVSKKQREVDQQVSLIGISSIWDGMLHTVTPPFHGKC